MNLADLIVTINRMEDDVMHMGMNPSEVQVVIRTSDYSIGPAPCATIRSIGHGIDWDNGKIFIFTDQQLVKKEKK